MIEHNKWPTIWESVYPGDEFGRYLGLLQDVYYDSMASDEMEAMCLKELEANLDFEQLTEHWHSYWDGKSNNVPLYTYLGMTVTQYNKYLHNESYRPWHDADYDNQVFLVKELPPAVLPGNPPGIPQ